MKKVFPSAEQTIHVWAQQSQESGRCSNVFFENTKVLYSYGYHFPLAVFLSDNIVLINNSNYSVTTSKQQGYVNGAISHKQKIYVPTDIIKFITSREYLRLDNLRDGCLKGFKKALREKVVSHINTTIEQQARVASKRRKKTLIESDIMEAQYVYQECHRLLEFFKIKMPAVTVRLINNLIDNHEEIIGKFAEKRKREVAKRKKEELKREKERLIEAQEAIELWKAGEPIIKYKHINALRNINTVYMRPWGDDKQIYTSHNAQFPINHGIAAFEYILDCRENKAGWKANGHKIHLGHFSIDKIDVNGNVTAGCHYVEFAEIERNAKLLNLI